MLLLALFIACHPSSKPDDTPAVDTGDTGERLVDGDLDGWFEDEDCDDADASVHPGAFEWCDGVDQDCDGALDDCGLSAAAATVVGAEGEQIGLSLSGEGDVDGDGEADLLIGSEHVGRAWLLLGPLSGAHETADADALLIGDSADDAFGAALAVPGDLDGDGYEEVVVGAPELGGRADAGAAMLFYGPVSGSFAAVEADATFFLPVSGSAGGAGVGSSLDRIGDVSGDGAADLMISAPGYDGGKYAPGLLCVLSQPLSGAVDLSTAPGVTCREGSSSGYSGQRLGEVVSGVGDLSGDGLAELAAGVPGSDVAYVYDGPFGAGEDHTLSGPTSSYAGCALAGAGDTNGDGYGDLIVGAYAEDHDGVTNTGAAYIVTGPLDGDSELVGRPVFYGSARTEGLGHAVSGVGDLDQDGLDDVAIAAPWNSEGGTSAGAVWLLLGPVSGTTLAESAQLIGPHEQDFLGGGLARAAGERFLVAAPYSDEGATSGGIIYLLGL